MPSVRQAGLSRSAAHVLHVEGKRVMFGDLCCVVTEARCLFNELEV